jgi:HEAT repeat protein
LGLLQTEKAIQPLVKLSSDPAPEVRAAATFGMAALQSKKNDFSQALGEMAADQSNFVQDRAKQGLDIVHRKNAAVMKHLGSDDSDERLFAALYFQNHGTHKDLAALKTKWEGESDEDVKLELEAAMKAIKKRAAGTAPAKKKPTTPTKKTKPT